MTIYDLLNKYEIKNKKIGKDKNVNIFCVGKLNVLFWINEGKSLK